MSKKKRPKSKKKGHVKLDGSKTEKRQSGMKTSKSPSETIPLPEIIAETIVDYLHEVEGDSPIHLKWENLIKIRTSPIEWTNYEAMPMTLSMRNTAYNVILTGTWPYGRVPSVTKGPMTSQYDFSQIHFHWGTDNLAGSDHMADGDSYPFEIHSVFYKASAGSIEQAKNEVDGVVIFCYLFKMQEHDNDKIRMITDNIDKMVFAYSKINLDPLPLETILQEITDDYIVYLGAMKYKTVYGVTFIICRDAQGISFEQLSKFRDLKDRHENPMILKPREIQPLGSRNVFLVNPKSGTKVIRSPSPPRHSQFGRNRRSHSAGVSTTSKKSLKKRTVGSVRR
ncbi:Carb_anhydrase [Nesidiocoris tenuis]|uniref:Carb_anhydrase n=1 Tax=Nesidiocoris tenuis TaxID=355587 RepID=A0ABN7B6P2_9HEMI|nr:Carb_anhydrase [Nesidiocoris tenuis]